jgi:hypothetical protein
MRKISPPPGFDPRIVQPIASRYIDWAIRAHPVWRVSLEFWDVTPCTFELVFLKTFIRLVNARNMEYIEQVRRFGDTCCLHLEYVSYSSPPHLLTVTYWWITKLIYMCSAPQNGPDANFFLCVCVCVPYCDSFIYKCHCHLLAFVAVEGGIQLIFCSKLPIMA